MTEFLIGLIAVLVLIVGAVGYVLTSKEKPQSIRGQFSVTRDRANKARE